MVGCTTLVVQETVSLFDVQQGRSISTVDDLTMDDGGACDGVASVIQLRGADIFSDE